MRSRAVWWRMVFAAGLGIACILSLVSCEWIGSLLQGDQPVATGSVGASGGTITVEDEDSVLVGLSVVVPEQGFSSATEINIRESQTAVAAPSGARSCGSSSFELASTGEILSTVRIDVPFDPSSMGEGEELILAWETEDGRWGLVFADSVDTETGVATFSLEHFSKYTLYFVTQAALAGTSLVRIDTRFDPYDDGFPIMNAGASLGAGKCYGMVLFTAWYYELLQNGASVPSLRFRYGSDEATKLAIDTQDAIGSQFSDKYFGDSEMKDVYQIVEEMRTTNLPVPVAVRNDDGMHAVLAYRWDGLKLYCFDPNAYIPEDESPEEVRADFDVAEIEQVNGRWQCTGADGTLFPDVSRCSGLDKYGGDMAGVYADWNPTGVEISISTILGDGPEDVITAGTEVEVCLKVENVGHEISSCVFLDVAPSGRQSEPIYDAHEADEDVWWGAWTGTKYARFRFTIPEEAAGGLYRIRAVCRDIGYAVDSLGQPVIYGSTGGTMQAGLEDAWIDAFAVCMPPPTPTGLVASDGESLGRIALEWDDDDSVFTYRLYRSSTETGSYKQVYVGPDATWEDTDVRPGSSYFYQVEAWTEDLPSEERAGPVEGSTAVLLPPSGVQGSHGAFPDRYRISWDVDPEIDEYEVAQCRWATGNFIEMERRTQEGYWDQTVISDDHYYYRVRAWYAGDCSEWSETVESWIDPAALVPDSPRGLTATQGDYSSKIKLRWDTSDGGDLYRIERAGSRSGSYEMLDEVADDPWEDLEPGPGETFWYRLSVKRDGQWSEPCDPVKGYTSDPDHPGSDSDPEPGPGNSSTVGFWSGSGYLSGTATVRSGGYSDAQSLYGDLRLQHEITGLIGSSVSGQWRFKPDSNVVDDEFEDLYAVLDTFMPYTSGQVIAGRLILVSEDSISEQTTIDGESIRLTLEARVAFTLNVNSSGHLVGSGDLNWTLQIRLLSTGETVQATVDGTISGIDMTRASRSTPWMVDPMEADSLGNWWDRFASWCLRMRE
ncbi:hypothetical protein JW848_08125 [Candidatus Bipolaricaulota bacterium]|nr:hypothetical protein [Candidatus Bipolaricaulota bacterium]